LGLRCVGEKGLGFWSGAVDAAGSGRMRTMMHACGRRDRGVVREKVVNPASDPWWTGEWVWPLLQGSVMSFRTWGVCVWLTRQGALGGSIMPPLQVSLVHIMRTS
jgi:hypothetical protein